MLIQLLVFLSVFSSSLGAKYDCSIFYYDDTNYMCTIYDLNTTKSDYIIEPMAEDPSSFIKIVLDGNIPVLTGGFCEVLTNLEYFESYAVSLETIKNSAFEGCNKMKEITMIRNNFTIIEKNSFKGLKNLEDLRLTGGNIPVFDVDLSDSKELKVLILSLLNITVFPAVTLREQKNLESLYLYSNNLFDLDVEEILKFTPKLKRIFLADNNFKCSRLREIKKLLNDKNITADTFHLENYIQKRDYTPDKIDGIHCLSDEQKWIDLYFEHSKIIPIDQFVDVVSSTKQSQSHLKLNENIEDVARDVEEVSKNESNEIMDPSYDDQTMNLNLNDFHLKINEKVEEFIESFKNNLADQLEKINDLNLTITDTMEMFSDTQDQDYLKFSQNLSQIASNFKKQKSEQNQINQANDEKILNLNMTLNKLIEKISRIDRKPLKDNEEVKEIIKNIQNELRDQQKVFEENLESFKNLLRANSIQNHANELIRTSVLSFALLLLVLILKF